MSHHDQLKAAIALATSEVRIWALLSHEERDEYHRRVKEKAMGSAMNRYEYRRRNGGAWGNVEEINGEYVVSHHSRYQGTTTGRVVAIPVDFVPEVAGKLLSDWADEDAGYTYGEVVLDWLERAEQNAPDHVITKIRVIDPGIQVQ